MSKGCSAQGSTSGTASASLQWMRPVIDIERAEWENEMQSATRPVLVHFRTSWCGQCRILAPSLEVLAGELEDELQVAQANLDHCPQVASRYGITRVPWLILFDNGAPIASIDAAMPPRQMTAHLRGLLADHTVHSAG